MKIVLLPSTATGPGSSLSTLVVNDTLAVDAGSLGLALPVAAQQRVRHVVLTHSHMDHIASLPMFLENVYRAGPDPVTVHAGPKTLAVLREHVFNEQLYPGAERLVALSPPFVQFEVLEPGRPVTLEGVRVTPLEIDHTIPTFAFRLESERAGVVVVTDTGPTGLIREIAGETPRLKAVFLEASFPDELAWLAEASKHLTAGQFLEQARRFPAGVAALAIHLKPRFAERVAAEIEAAGLGHVRVAVPGHEYRF